MNPDKRAREDDHSILNEAKRPRTKAVQDEKISKVFSGFMSDYLKLNWVNEDENPHIPPKYVLTDMIMEKFFREAKWQEVATANEVVEYLNRCLTFHGMSLLEAQHFPNAYAAWKECFSKDFNSMELESAEVLCQLKKVLSHGRKEEAKPANAEPEEMKSDDANEVPMFNPATKLNEELKVSPTVPVESPPVVSPNPPEAKLEIVNDTGNRVNYGNHYNNLPPQNRFPPQTHAYHSQMYQPSQTYQRPARYEMFEEKQIRFNSKKNLFDLTVLIKGSWQNLGSFQTHTDAITSWKILRSVANIVTPFRNSDSLYSNNQSQQPHQYSVNQMPQNMPSAPIPSSMQHESTIVVYKLPTQKVIQLIHRLPSINLSDPWQLTQLVCLYLCLFARISIKMLCSLRESHVNVNTISPNSLGSTDVKKPFVTVVVGHPMCIKHLKCMCSEAHDMCNVLCVVTVLTLYQNQKNETGASENQVFVRGIALAPNGISRCLTQTPLRETNKLQLAQWLKKITSKFTH